MKYPLGECQCGCGGKTKIADRTVYKLGYIKGVPRRFIYGHGSRQQKLLEAQSSRGKKYKGNLIPARALGIKWYRRNGPYNAGNTMMVKSLADRMLSKGTS